MGIFASFSLQFVYNVCTVVSFSCLHHRPDVCCLYCIEVGTGTYIPSLYLGTKMVTVYHYNSPVVWCSPIEFFTHNVMFTWTESTCDVVVTSEFLTHSVMFTWTELTHDVIFPSWMYHPWCNVPLDWIHPWCDVYYLNSSPMMWCSLGLTPPMIRCSLTELCIYDVMFTNWIGYPWCNVHLDLMNPLLMWCSLPWIFHPLYAVDCFHPWCDGYSLKCLSMM